MAASLLSRRAHLLTTHKMGGGIPFGVVRSARLCGSVGALCTMPHLLSLSTQSAQGFPFWQSLPWAGKSPTHPAACLRQLCPEQILRICSAAFRQLWVSHSRRHPFSLFKRETERKDGEAKWQSIIWKQK